MNGVTNTPYLPPKPQVVIVTCTRSESPRTYGRRWDIQRMGDVEQCPACLGWEAECTRTITERPRNAGE